MSDTYYSASCSFDDGVEASLNFYGLHAGSFVVEPSANNGDALWNASSVIHSVIAYLLFDFQVEMSKLQEDNIDSTKPELFKRYDDNAAILGEGIAELINWLLIYRYVKADYIPAMVCAFKAFKNTSDLNDLLNAYLENDVYNGAKHTAHIVFDDIDYEIQIREHQQIAFKATSIETVGKFGERKRVSVEHISLLGVLPVLNVLNAHMPNNSRAQISVRPQDRH